MSASLASPAASLSTSTRYKVYTKTGDAGTTSLFNGERRSKDDDFFSALGDVDELNASVGLSREYCVAGGVALEAQLVEIQCRLLDVGSAIATPIGTSTPGQLERARFHSGITAALEGWIDAMDEELPPLKNFILPVRVFVGRAWRLLPASPSRHTPGAPFTQAPLPHPAPPPNTPRWLVWRPGLCAAPRGAHHCAQGRAPGRHSSEGGPALWGGGHLPQPPQRLPLCGGALCSPKVGRAGGGVQEAQGEVSGRRGGGGGCWRKRKRVIRMREQMGGRRRKLGAVFVTLAVRPPTPWCSSHARARPRKRSAARAAPGLARPAWCTGWAS